MAIGRGPTRTTGDEDGLAPAHSASRVDHLQEIVARRRLAVERDTGLDRGNRHWAVGSIRPPFRLFVPFGVRGGQFRMFGRVLDEAYLAFDSEAGTRGTRFHRATDGTFRQADPPHR